MRTLTMIAAGALLAGALTAGAEGQRPYIFTQAHNNDVQAFTQNVSFGVPLQVQLPGGPSVWAYVGSGSRNLTTPVLSKVPSPRRIDNTDAVFVFDFKSATPGLVVAIFEAQGLPGNLKPLFPKGRFVLNITAVRNK